jgi:hypothetical protein
MNRAFSVSITGWLKITFDADQISGFSAVRRGIMTLLPIFIRKRRIRNEMRSGCRGLPLQSIILQVFNIKDANSH